MRWGDGSQVRTTEIIRRLEPPAAAPGGARDALLAYEFLGPLRALHLVRGTRLQRPAAGAWAPWRAGTSVLFGTGPAHGIPMRWSEPKPLASDPLEY